jgi:hypothetical protein
MAVATELTPDGKRITVSRVVDAPAAFAWELLANTGHWPDWGPPVTAVDPAETTITAGMDGRVQAFGAFWVPFRVERCADRRWTWSVKGFSPPADGHRVEAVDDDRARIVLECPLWAPWYIPLCAKALANLARLCRDRD